MQTHTVKIPTQLRQDFKEVCKRKRITPSLAKRQAICEWMKNHTDGRVDMFMEN